MLPLQSEGAALEKFLALAEEARRWKGEPTRTVDADTRRLVGWADLEIRQAGRGVVVRVRAPWFSGWWCDPATWQGEPMGRVYDWLAEEDRAARR